MTQIIKQSMQMISIMSTYATAAGWSPCHKPPTPAHRVRLHPNSVFSARRAIIRRAFIRRAFMAGALLAIALAVSWTDFPGSAHTTLLHVGLSKPPLRAVKSKPRLRVGERGGLSEGQSPQRQHTGQAKGNVQWCLARQTGPDLRQGTGPWHEGCVARAVRHAPCRPLPPPERLGSARLP